MLYSLLLESKSRLSHLKSFLENVYESTEDKNEVEVIVVVERNDITYMRQRRTLEQKNKSINLKIIPRAATHKNHMDFAFRQSKGKYVFKLNDSCKFTKSWDKKTSEILKNDKDGIISGKSGSCYLISRKALDILGTFGTDLDKIFTEINRKLDISDIVTSEIYEKEGLIRTHLNPLIGHLNGSENRSKKVLVVYNICGISRNENHEYYCQSLNSILAQDFDFDLVVSGCMTSPRVKSILQSRFNIFFNWIDSHQPLNVTFNHTVKECVRRFGSYDGYLYVDSGITFGNDRNVIKKMYDLKEKGYCMVASRVDVDDGFDAWKITWDKKEDYVIPLGLS